jgi:aspartate aminotransferase
MALHDVVTELRAAGKTIVDLAKGEPDQPTPAVVTDAAVAALRDGHTRYTVGRGIPELRNAIARKLSGDNGIQVDPDEGIVVTPSAKHALFVAMMTLLDPGDEIIVPSPGWVSYRAMAHLAGARAVPAQLPGTNGFRLTREILDGCLTDRTRAVLVNTPNNPTGRVLDATELDALAEFVTEHDLFVVTDEIYETIRFRGSPHLSVAARPECADRQRAVQEPRDDRLAAGLPGRPAGPDRDGAEGPGAHGQLRDLVRAARRGGRADRRGGRRGADGVRVRAQTRSRGVHVGRSGWHRLPATGRHVLRVP